MFGAPQLTVQLRGDRIAGMEIIRGAPCGATWEAARRITGWPCDEAIARFGLETQFFCSADPAGWDPIHGHSPVHFAAEVHMAALRKALKKFRKR